MTRALSLLAAALLIAFTPRAARAHEECEDPAAAAAPAATPANGHAHHHHHGGSGEPSAAGREALARATSALDRFQDPDVAESEGYQKPWRNDGFMMGEHWYHPERLGNAGVCDLEKPGFLQYLVIDGRRTLIGTGYVCDATPDWFGPEVAWHRHGPALCRMRKGAFMDFQYLADALPNARNDATWQAYCGKVWGTAQDHEVAMLHTWNWIAQPDGALVHENRAIPFLRAGLRVPDKTYLDGDEGAAALAALRLAHGDWKRRYEGAMLVADVGFWRRVKARRELRAAQAAGDDALERMRAAQALGDAVQFGAAARAGAAEARALSERIGALLEPDERQLVDSFLASLVVHDSGM